jgi:hypothetical protein
MLEIIHIFTQSFPRHEVVHLLSYFFYFLWFPTQVTQKVYKHLFHYLLSVAFAPPLQILRGKISVPTPPHFNLVPLPMHSFTFQIEILLPYLGLHNAQDFAQILYFAGGVRIIRSCALVIIFFLFFVVSHIKI